MVKLNCARIAPSRPQQGEFGMIACKVVNVANELCRTCMSCQVRMALRTVRVTGRGEANGSPVIRVAGRARRREFLRGMMNCCIMAGQAFLIGNFFTEKPNLRDVTSCTLLREYSMRWRQAAGR